tara:strand:+ start:359 stop:580 length:222 start_codon:yes stop_codon:yes gene_type:complete
LVVVVNVVVVRERRRPSHLMKRGKREEREKGKEKGKREKGKRIIIQNLAKFAFQKRRVSTKTILDSIFFLFRA